MRCTRRTEHVVKAIVTHANRWRRVAAAVLLLVVVTCMAGWGPQGERLGWRAYADTPSVARLSTQPPLNCAIDLGYGSAERLGNFVQWSRDGASIVFDGPNGLYQAAANGSAVRLLDTEPTRGWHAFDLAPDGRQIVYSSCPDQTYNLHRASIDGTWSERLAEDYGSTLFASWSPDGTRIAVSLGGLTVMAVDGSTARPIKTDIWSVDAPRWSPDSQRLAVTGGIRGQVRGGPGPRPIDYTDALYTVRADGSDPRRLVRRVVSAPTWSPDGQWLAYARVYRNAVILAAIRADGTDERLITTIREGAHSRGPNQLPFWIRTVAWSPDAKHLLYSCGEFLEHLCVVTTDGRLVGRTPVELPGVSMGAWSPDGTRIAVVGLGPYVESWGHAVSSDVVLYTMTPFGTRPCPLVIVRHDADSRNPIERLWRLVFGLEAEYPLVAVRDCEAAA